MKEVRQLIKTPPGKEMTSFYLFIVLRSGQVASELAVIHRGELIAQGSVSELLGGELTEYGIEARDRSCHRTSQGYPWVEVFRREQYDQGSSGAAVVLELNGSW